MISTFVLTYIIKRLLKAFCVFLIGGGALESLLVFLILAGFLLFFTRWRRRSIQIILLAMGMLVGIEFLAPYQGALVNLVSLSSSILFVYLFKRRLFKEWKPKGLKRLIGILV